MTGDGKAHLMSWKLEEDDTSPPPPPDDPGEEHPSLRWLREQWAKGNTKELESVVEFWRYCRSLGRAGNVLMYLFKKTGQVIMWASGVFVAWFAMSGNFGEWWNRKP
jgi:hypothetical protein